MAKKDSANTKHEWEGKKVPSLKTKNHDGDLVNIKDLLKKSSHTILYFYPRDNTPGCTQESCDFRDEWNEIKKYDTQIIGVSPDSPESHTKFRQQHKLPFILLSDQNKELLQALGVWQQKSFMGKKFMGVVRSTFVIDSSTKILKVWQPVKVKDHVKSVIDFLKELNKQ